jgi:hypothetical protein
MEFRRAYWDEQPDGYLVERHEREIFPLLRRRYLFAGVANFLLYDLFAPDGRVNEDVFAYSNRVGDERVLVVYHNRYAEARGWIRTSVAYAIKAGPGDENLSRSGEAKVLEQKSLGEGLGLHDDGDVFTIFRDHVTGLEYIRNSRELGERGLYVELSAYKCHVFLDFRQVRDNEWHQYAHLAAYLDGRGVPSIEEALKEVFLQPVHRPFRELVNVHSFRRLMDARVTGAREQLDPELAHEIERKTAHLLREIGQLAPGDGGEAAMAVDAIASQVGQELEVILHLPVWGTHFHPCSAGGCEGAAEYLRAGPSTTDQRSVLRAGPSTTDQRSALRAGLGDDPVTWGTLLGWLFTHALGKVVDGVDFEQVSRTWIDAWLLGKIIAGALQDLGLDEGAAWYAVETIKVLTSHQRWFQVRSPVEQQAHGVIESWMKDDDVRRILQVNRYQGVLWFNKEAFERLLWWMLLLAAVAMDVEPLRPQAEEEFRMAHDVVGVLLEAARESGYQVEALLELVEG